MTAKRKQTTDVPRLKAEHAKLTRLIGPEIKAGHWFNVSVIAGRLATVCGQLNRALAEDRDMGIMP